MQFDSPPNPPNSWPRSKEKDKRPSILSPQHGEPPDSMTHEDECPIPSFSNRNIVVCEAETSNFVMGKGHPVSRLMSRSDIRSRQIEFWNQISAAGNSLNGCWYHRQYIFSSSLCFMMLFIAAVSFFISCHFRCFCCHNQVKVFCFGDR